MTPAETAGLEAAINRLLDTQADVRARHEVFLLNNLARMIGASRG
jgi:hypothetical protein